MKPIYKDKTRTNEERIQDLLVKMTLEEDVEPGLYDILIGPNSHNVTLEGTFEVKAQ